ncbi:MAG TPA: KEOPS complex subunit Cgi121 [Spirochaetia bacterium]|nr:KEOPS complex subunit Cgi121 [Spirochaetia bacterium]
MEGLLGEIRRQSPEVIVQVIGAARAPNPRAVEMIAAQTLMAARAGSTLAERPELDLLLRLAGTRQIGEAFRRVGYKSNGKRFFMVAASEGNGAALSRMGKRLAADKRFTKVEKKQLEEGDLEQVERAALLAARL